MLKDSFCSSPWFHARITYDGSFEKCRWVKSSKHTDNIQQTSLLTYFNKEEMSTMREKFLAGNKPAECETCYYQEQFGKLSGRQKQLLKSAITVNDFTNSFVSSPHFKEFTYTYSSYGKCAKKPTDLQIDLGNLCNSSCIMCDPVASSKLTQDYEKLSVLSNLFPAPTRYTSWTENPKVFETFLNELASINDLKYIHLLGGETLYNKSFYKICDHLINIGNSKNIIIGTTTNGTIYSEELEKIIPQFKEFHLGISIESITSLNDYVRYPSNVNDILTNIKKFIALRDIHPSLHLTLRITPNIFTAYELDQLFEFMIENRIVAEACNILHKPECLRMELMPDDIRQESIKKIERLVEKYSLEKHSVENIRNHHLIDKVNADTVIDYLNFLKNYSVPENANELRQQLVEFLKSFEKIRNNSIIDYAPRFQNFLRDIGF